MPNRNFHLMHPRNLYRVPPDFKEMIAKYPELGAYFVASLDGRMKFDFANQDGLRLLSTVLLEKDFGLRVDLPVGKLVPTIPLRLNYLLWIEDLFNLNHDVPKKIKGIDIGTGASCIYPLLAAKKFQWSMVGTDINKESIKNAKSNIEKNNLQHLIQVLEVSEWDKLLPVTENEHYDFCMCNPPFHNLPNLNSSDDETDCAKELTCELFTAGGEVDFIKKIIRESQRLQNSVSIYTTMVGYKSSLGPLKTELKDIGTCAVAEAGFFQGRTTRWGIAWTFDPKIKLSNFMPQKMLQKEKLKPPMSFSIPKSYNSTTALNKLTELLANYKFSISTLNSKSNENILYQAIIKAYKNTWVRQRLKRRFLQRLADNKRQKTDETSHHESNNETIKENVEDVTEDIPENTKALFTATLVLRNEDDTIWIDILHLDGSKENVHQVFQFFKNNLI